jgi:Na+-transporting NADH:ubiquinone oxidoreductase subunit C
MANNTKGLSTNSNTYTVIYAAVMVIIVAFLLSFVSSALKERQDNNKSLDVKKQILSSLNVNNVEDAQAEYEKYVKQVLNADGSVKESATTFDVLKESETPIIYQCDVNGETKYVFPLRGNGLWGAIGGYIAVNADESTCYGIFFRHDSETPGLGAEITTDKFKSQFVGKNIKRDGVLTSIAVLKKGTKAEGQDQVDAISGATLTCNGVNEMLSASLKKYDFLTKK